MTVVDDSGRLGEWRDASVAFGGGVLIVIGALLPWMSLLAGLERYPGVAGLNGRLVLAAGALSVAGGVMLRVRPNHRFRIGVGALGAALLVFTCWILLGLRSATRELGHHPFLLARPGPGLFVVLAGASTVVTLLLPNRKRT